MKTLSCSYVKYNHRIPLPVLLIVEKTQHEILILLFFLLFPRAQLTKYTAYMNDLHAKRMHYYQRSSFSWLELHAS